MWTNWVGQKTETNEEHDEDCVEKIVREAVQLLRWGIVVTIFEMEQNQNQLNPGKMFHILKTIFQYFYYLVTDDEDDDELFLWNG